MRVLRLTVLGALGILLPASASLGAPGAPPTGYLFSNVSTGLTVAQVTNINQMVFKPGDTTHLYASRGFSGVVTRYNYNAVTGQLSNPVDVVNLNGVADGMKAITGIGFHGAEMWITRWPGWTLPRPAAISRMLDSTGNDGIYETRDDIVTGMEIGNHTINEIQIAGDTLYTGIGTTLNTGDPSQDQVYNGTIARIGDLNNPIVMNLTTTPDRATFAATGVSDGHLRMYAGGFRNPYGLRFDANGKLWVSDNGADASGTFPETPDLLYKDVKLNDFGNFPPPGQPGAPANPIAPFSILGSHTGAGGLDFIPSGPDRGNVLVAEVSSNNGHKLAMVNSLTGAATSFITGFSTPTDVVADPFGRLLVADTDGNAVYLLTPPLDGDANLDRKVDIQDLLALATHWKASGGWANGDFDRNGFIDNADLAILASHWQAGANGSLSGALSSFGLSDGAVPEPCGIGFGLVGLVALARRVRAICPSTPAAG
jgi:hypothetical protein